MAPSAPSLNRAKTQEEACLFFLQSKPNQWYPSEPLIRRLGFCQPPAPGAPALAGWQHHQCLIASSHQAPKTAGHPALETQRLANGQTKNPPRATQSKGKARTGAHAYTWQGNYFPLGFYNCAGFFDHINALPSHGNRSRKAREGAGGNFSSLLLPCKVSPYHKFLSNSTHRSWVKLLAL